MDSFTPQNPLPQNQEALPQTERDSASSPALDSLLHDAQPSATKEKHQARKRKLSKKNTYIFGGLVALFLLVTGLVFGQVLLSTNLDLRQRAAENSYILGDFCLTSETKCVNSRTQYCDSASRRWVQSSERDCGIGGGNSTTRNTSYCDSFKIVPSGTPNSSECTPLQGQGTGPKNQCDSGFRRNVGQDGSETCIDRAQTTQLPFCNSTKIVARGTPNSTPCALEPNFTDFSICEDSFVKNENLECVFEEKNTLIQTFDNFENTYSLPAGIDPSTLKECPEEQNLYGSFFDSVPNSYPCIEPLQNEALNLNIGSIRYYCPKELNQETSQCNIILTNQTFDNTISLPEGIDPSTLKDCPEEQNLYGSFFEPMPNSSPCILRNQNLASIRFYCPEKLNQDTSRCNAPNPNPCPEAGLYIERTATRAWCTSEIGTFFYECPAGTVPSRLGNSCVQNRTDTTTTPTRKVSGDARRVTDGRRTPTSSRISKTRSISDCPSGTTTVFESAVTNTLPCRAQSGDTNFYCPEYFIANNNNQSCEPNVSGGNETASQLDQIISRL